MADKFLCDASPVGCGPLEYVLFDGYIVAERILEGVMFRVYYNGSGGITVTTDENWKENRYLSGLNEKKWLKEALEFAKELEVATCPKCGNDVDGPVMFTESSSLPAPVTTIGLTGDQMLDRLLFRIENRSQAT